MATYIKPMVHENGRLCVRIADVPSEHQSALEAFTRGRATPDEGMLYYADLRAWVMTEKPVGIELKSPVDQMSVRELSQAIESFTESEAFREAFQRQIRRQKIGRNDDEPIK